MSIVYWHLGMDPDAAKAYILSRLKNELDPKWTYHSLEHTLDVYASVIGIAEQEGVEGQDLVLLRSQHSIMMPDSLWRIMTMRSAVAGSSEKNCLGSGSIQSRSNGSVA